MNANTRRYLDEDWDDEIEEPTSKREQKPAKNPVAQTRQQKQKEWGRAITKFQRQHAKRQGPNRKP